MQVLTRKDKTLSILKSVWARKDGSKWKNIGNGIEPYHGSLKIPSHIPTEDESGGGESNNLIWVSNPFKNKQELAVFLNQNSKPFRNLFPGKTKQTLDFETFSKVWDQEFGDEKILTPIGKIKIGNHQKQKNFYKSDNRLLLIGNLKETLKNPILIIKDKSDSSKEREFAYLFVSTFNDLKKSKHYVCTSVQIEKSEIVISSGERDLSGLYGKINAGKTLFIQTPRSTDSPGSRVLGLTHEGDSLKEQSKNEIGVSQGNKDIEKSFLGFGVKPSSNGNVGLIKKVITDKNGRRQTKWVRPDEPTTPKEKQQAEAKAQRKQFRDLPKHSPEDQKKVEEILQRHKDFEDKAKEQRRVYGPGPMLPKPGLIMRVYAKGKVNVGGMLAEIKQVANDGKTVIAQLTSGKTYSFPLDQLQFAKSNLASDMIASERVMP